MWRCGIGKQGQLVTLHPPAERRRGKLRPLLCWLSPVPIFICSRICFHPCGDNDCFEGRPPSQLNFSGVNLYRHTQSYVSYMILSPAKLSVKMNHTFDLLCLLQLSGVTCSLWSLPPIFKNQHRLLKLWISGSVFLSTWKGHWWGHGTAWITQNDPSGSSQLVSIISPV